MLRRLMLASNSSGSSVDPFWSSVLFLLRMDGSATDVKGRPFVIAGTPSFVAGRFGQALAPGSGASGVTDNTPEHTDYALGSGDFTIECWLKQAAGSIGGAVISHFDIVGTNGWQLYLSGGEPQFYQYAGAGGGSGGSYPLTAAGVDIRDGEWHHIAIARSAGVMRLFVDGAIVASTTNPISYGYSLLYMSIGYQRQGNSRYTFNGAIDEVRITKGVGRYTSTFTVPSAPFPGS